MERSSGCQSLGLGRLWYIDRRLRECCRREGDPAAQVQRLLWLMALQVDKRESEWDRLLPCHVDAGETHMHTLGYAVKMLKMDSERCSQWIRTNADSGLMADDNSCSSRCRNSERQPSAGSYRVFSVALHSLIHPTRSTIVYPHPIKQFHQISTSSPKSCRNTSKNGRLDSRDSGQRCHQATWRPCGRQNW